MVEATKQGEFFHVALAALSFSKSLAQAERRKHFEDAGLKELTESIKVHGVAQPIVVRPMDNGSKAEHFEVVAGERRVISSRKAGLVLIPAMVRTLTDDQAIDLQLVENLQREGLHELVECEGYEDLRKRKYTVEQIADKVGKSTSYVYKRLELSACRVDVRKAFYEGKIDASKALLVSRLQSDELQKKALKEITASTDWNEPMSFRQAARHIRENYMLRLDQAPFKTEDAALVAAAGACGKCPKNSAQQTGLFGDVSKAALCTDSACFRSKVDASAAAAIAAARVAGKTVLEGKQAKTALNHGSAFAKLDDTCYEDSKYRKYAQLLGKDAKEVVTIAVDPDSGKAVELVKKDEAKKLIKKRGVTLKSPSSGYSAPKRSAKQIEADKAKEAKAKAEEKLLIAVAQAIHLKTPKPFTLDELHKIAELVFENSPGGEQVLEIIGSKTAYPRFETLNEAGLLRAIRGSLLAAHIDEGDKGVVFAEAKRHGVDVEKIKADLTAPPAEKKPAAKSKAKKAAKKK